VFGDKKYKSLLYMGARSAVKHNKEYRLYYQRKQPEDKPHYLSTKIVSYLLPENCQINYQINGKNEHEGNFRPILDDQIDALVF